MILANNHQRFSDFVYEYDEEDSFELCLPTCDELIKPVVGRTFKTIEEGMKFYESYANVCGFESRKSTLKKADNKETVITRYMLCSREGLREKIAVKSAGNKSTDEPKRRRLSCRVDCMARIVLSYDASVGYRITTFNEGHTHQMIPEEYRYLMKSNRQVDAVHQMFILSGIKANIGPMRTFRLYKELVGGYDFVGATKIDFKNYARDLRVFVDGVDAQIVVDNFKFRKENSNGFYYSFEVTEQKKLSRLFWADSKSVKNFKLFGDAVSFDATYATNRFVY